MNTRQNGMNWIVGSKVRNGKYAFKLVRMRTMNQAGRGTGGSYRRKASRAMALGAMLRLGDQICVRLRMQLLSARPRHSFSVVEIPIPCEVSDRFWSQVEPLIPTDKGVSGKMRQRAPGGGRKPVDTRRTLASILYVLRNGISWSASPSEFSSVQTVHRRFKIWQKAGFFRKIRRFAQGGYPELENLAWERTEETGDTPRKSPTVAALSRSTPVCETSEREPTISDMRVQSLLMRLHGVTDSATFWNALQSLFRETIPNNSMVAYLDYFDHPKTWMAAKILATENASMPAAWFEERWKLDITPRFLQSHPGIKFFRFSDIISDPKEFQNSDYFTQFFKPHGWYYTACLSYWHGAGVNSVIALRRTQEQGDYRPGEIELFKKIHPHVETVLKRLLPTHKEQTKAQWLGEFAQHLPLPLLLLDWNLEPIYINREALDQCACWNFGPAKARSYDPRAVFRAPSEVLRTCEKLKVLWLEESTPAGRPEQQRLSRQVSHPLVAEFSATITVQTDSKGLISKPGFLVYFDQRKTPDPQLARAERTAMWRLTSAERDLVQLASAGLSNKDIAVQLHKSINTVKHQMTSVYSKLGINGRGKRLVNSLAAI
jgi:DNA-binding CsgD family transcriptional regulator/transposase